MVGIIGSRKIPGEPHGERMDTSRCLEDWATVELDHSGCNQYAQVQSTLDEEMICQNSTLKCQRFHSSLQLTNSQYLLNEIHRSKGAIFTN